MTPATFELMKTAARTLLAHVAAGRSCDPHSVDWARALLAQNPDRAPALVSETPEEEITR